MKKIARGILVLTLAVLLVFSSVAIGLAQEEKIIEPSVTPTATASMEPTPTVSTEPTPTVSAEPTPTTSTEVAPVPTESAESMNGIELSPNESSTPTHSTENILSSPSALVDIEANPLTGAVTNLRWAENIDSTEQTVNANIGEAVTLTVPSIVNDDPVNYPIQYQWYTPATAYGETFKINGAIDSTYETPYVKRKHKLSL